MGNEEKRSGAEELAAALVEIASKRAAIEAAEDVEGVVGIALEMIDTAVEALRHGGYLTDGDGS